MSYIDAGYAVVLVGVAAYAAVLVRRRGRLERLAARLAGRDGTP